MRHITSLRCIPTGFSFSWKASPKDYPIEAPGDLVQLDTMELRPLPGVVRQHFTGIDRVSRWRGST